MPTRSKPTRAKPEPSTILVLVASDVDRTPAAVQAAPETATIVECCGLKPARGMNADPRAAARQAEVLVRKAAPDAGGQIDASRGAARGRACRERHRPAARGRRAPDALHRRKASKISIADAREVVSAATSQDDWAVTNAIGRRDTPSALRELGLALESGGVSFAILGQIAWFVREKLAQTDPRRVPEAVDALLRTDLDLKSSGGDPRVLLERLVVELCRA